MKKYAYSHIVMILLMFAILFSSCSSSELASATPTYVEPTPTEVPLKELTLCAANEPDTLFLYGDYDNSAELFFQAIYDGPFDMVDYLPQAIIVEKTPNLEDGSASYQPVGVNSGDLIMDVQGNVTNLTEGVRLFPRDCHSLDCAITWDGVAQLQMDQLVLVYTIVDGVRWSDGENVKATDAQYSYQLASELEVDEYEETLAQITSYQALDDRTVQVTTLPGVVTSDYNTYFFNPLPQHVWGGYAADELENMDMAAKYPLGWGAFVITSWQAGESIVLEKNENYFRSAEGYPAIDIIEVKFIPSGDSIEQMMQEAGCDIVDASLITSENYTEVNLLQANSEYTVDVLPGTDWEVLLFGIEPASYDDGYYPYGSDRPDMLSNAAVRNAIRQCIDVDALLAQIGIEGLEKPFAYFPFAPSSENVSASTVQYDPASAVATLNEIGWKDYDSNPTTPREASGVENVLDGTKLTLNLYTSQSSQKMMIAQAIQTSLTNCGIQTNIYSLPVSELYAAGEEGVLFGRNFDLALISWNIDTELPCELFESEEIPTEANYWIGEDDGGGNIGAYQNSNFDYFCELARYGSSDASSALANQVQAAKILEQETPFISLFFQPEIYIYRSALVISAAQTREEYPYSFMEYWNFSGF